MENSSEQRNDIFADAWEDEAGGIVADSRQDEELPEDARDAPEARDPDPDAPGEPGDGIPRPEGPAEPVPGGRSAAERRDREIGEFMREYPDVRAEDIPPEVWGRVAAGESLLSAYSRHEARALRRENAALVGQIVRQERARVNRQRSAGSQMGAGTGKSVRDPFDDGWELEW